VIVSVSRFGIIALSMMTFMTATSFVNLYQTQEARQSIAETMVNPAMSAMVGQGYGLDNLSSTLSVLLGMNIVLALVVGFGLYALQIESMDLQGSIIYGTALGVTGIFFGSLTALFAQLSENSRGTIGLSFAALIISYIIRAIGDAGMETLSWFSPLGWVLGAEVYVNNYGWPILFTIVTSIVIAVFSLYLNAIRDLGSGFLPARPGRKHASPFLQSPLGLSFRLQRTGIISWILGMVVLGLTYGSVLGDIESYFEGVELLEEMLIPVEGLTIAEQFLTMIMSVIVLISTIPVLMTLFKLKGEENKNYSEHLLARAVSRTKLLGSYYLVSFIVGFLVLSGSVIGLWSAGNAVLEDGIAFSLLFKAAMIYLPAI
jgi:ABC-2 type transport system permease protein